MEKLEQVMQENLEALQALKEIVSGMEKHQAEVNRVLAIKVYQIEQSIKTAGWYPIELATRDYDESVGA